MAIKFNLIVDDFPARTLEELRENFSLEDVLRHYETGLLGRWLGVRGYDDERDAVARIDADSEQAVIAEQLIRILDVDIDVETLQTGLEVLRLLTQERERTAVYRETELRRQDVIDDYHKGYDELIQHMISSRDSWPTLLADAVQLERAYARLFSLDSVALYWKLKREAPKAIFAILSRDRLRTSWLAGVQHKATRVTHDLQGLVASKPELIEMLGDDLRVENRDTQAMWDSIVRPETSVLALSISDGSFVKNAGVFGEKLGAAEVNGKFLRLQGLDYQCSSCDADLMYLQNFPVWKPERR